jgi:FkbM family methyltransferase
MQLTWLPTAAQVFRRLPRAFRRHRLITAWMALTGEDHLQLVRIRGNAFGYVNLSDGFLRLIVVEGGFEHELLALADAFLRDGGVFLDVGANHGLVSFGLAGKHGSAVEFHLFEPNPELLSTITRTQALYPDMRCKVVPSAVTDHEGRVSFTVVPEQTGVSHIDPKGELSAPAVTLDRYLPSAGVAEAAFMKIDIEGYELGALRGAEESLKTRRIMAVYFEYCEKLLTRDRGHHALLDFIESVGYAVCFCRASDLAACGGSTHTVRYGLPGHGLPLKPIAGHTPPRETDLLALPKENLVELAGA